MLSPEIDRAEAFRLINEIGMADVWAAITYDADDKRFRLHSHLTEDDALLLMLSYIVSDERLMNKLKTIL